MKIIRCQICVKLLAKSGKFDNLQIKCPRCKTLNHFSLSATSATPEVHETPSDKGARDDKSIPKSTPTIRRAKKNVFKGISQDFGQNPK